MKLYQFKTKRSRIILVLLVIAAGLSLPAQAANIDLFVGNLANDSVLRYDGVTGNFLGTFVAPGSGGLQTIQGLTIGPDGNLYVSSWSNGSIKRYNGTTGAFIDDFVPSGSGGLSNPDQVVFGPNGNLYVSDRFAGSIRRYNGTTGAFIDTFISDGRLGGFVGFTFGPDANIYASMFNGSQRILRFNGATGAFMNAFGEGQPPANSAYSGLVFGPDGNLYASRYHADRIERFDPTTGVFVDLFVPTSSGGLAVPDYLTFGPDGNLYVNSLSGNSVLRYDGKTGAFIDVFASGGGLVTPKGLVFTSGVPLHAFSADVTLDFGALPNDDTFEAKGTFTLGDGSDGIDPLTEDVRLQVGAFSTTIPAGSFTQDRKREFTFEGVINHVALKVVIHPLSEGKFKFEGSGAGAYLTGTLVPLTVRLTIGDDGGNISLANGKAKFKKTQP